MMITIVDAYGNALPVGPEMKSPFAVVANFQEEIKYDVGSFDNIELLHQYIASKFESENVIHAFSVVGYFNKLDLCSEHPQPEGHKPLSETIAKVQNSYALDDTEGTIVGFWFPAYHEEDLCPRVSFSFYQ